MKTKLLILLGWLAIGVSAIAQTTIQPIQMGKLTTDLNANTQDIVQVKAMTFGATTLSAGLLTSPAARIHIVPEGTAPTTAADGIWWGTDVKIYRSAASTLHLVGNLDITGTITANGQDPILPGSNTTWTGNNTWNTGTATFSNGLTVGTGGVAFSGSGAADTRTNLGLVIGTNVQAYSAILAGIVGLSPTANQFMVYDGGWTAKSPADARTSIQLSSADSPTFTNLTLSGTLGVTGTTTLTNLAASGTITLGGDANLYRSAADTLKTDDSLIVAGSTTLAGVAVSGTMTFGGDATLYRSAADILKTDDTFVANYLTPSHPLGVAYGGLGLDVTAQTANQLFYTNGTGLSLTSITSYGRDIIGQTSVANIRTYLGLGTLATQSGTFSGTSSGTNTGDQTITLSGDVSGSGTGAITATLGTSGVTAATYGSGTDIPVLVIDAKGRVTSASTTSATPVIGVNSVALGTNTTGAYLATITTPNDPTGNLKFTGSSPASGTESAAIVIDTVQDIKTTSSPTFAGLTLSGTYSGVNASLSGTLGVAGVTTLSNATASTTTSTGALVISTGGLGIGGAVNIGGATSVGGALSTTGATTLASTLGVTGATTLTGALVINNTALIARNATGTSFTVGYGTSGSVSNPTLQVTNSNAGTNNTGIQIAGGVGGSGAAISVISSATNDGLAVDAKGTGTTTINGTATGPIVLARATTVSTTLGVTGATTLSSTLDVTGATTFGSSVTTTGATVPSGGVTAAGGFSVSPRLVHTGGISAGTATTGTDTSNTNTILYVAEVFIPANCTVTGVNVLWGSATASNVKVMLFDSAGTRVALSASTATPTAAGYGAVPFSSTYAAKGPATYYVGVICETSTTTKIRTHVVGVFGAGTVTSLVYSTESGYASITVPTTFTTGVGPIATLY